MDINETMAREIAQQLGIGGGGARADQDVIRRLEGKSDTELMQELARLQSQLAANNIGPRPAESIGQESNANDERTAAAAPAAGPEHAGRVGTCRAAAKENGRQVPPAGVSNVFFGTRKFNSSSFFWRYLPWWSLFQR